LNTNYTVVGLKNTDAASGVALSYSGSPTGNLANASVGTYSITATGLTLSSGSLSNYTVGYLSGILTVTKAILTITAEDKSKLYGAAVPALTYKYLGLVNGDVAPSTLPAIITTALASSPVDSYPITVSAAADANYTINYVPGILIVDKVPLTITAENKTKVYGTANPILTYTYSGLVNGDPATITWPTIITAALPNSPVGAYEIIPSAAIDPNYTISYVNGSLTVTKAPLTITAKPHIITYNGTVYTGGNGVVPTGLAAGESISNLTGTLNYTGTSQGAKNVGSYTIIPGGLSSPNYDINYVGDNLEIKKATLNVVAGDQSVNFKTELAKILNDAVYTYSGLVGGDNASDITGSVTYTTNYTPLTSTGASGIYIEPIITGLSNSNYDIIAFKGTITITAPPSSPVFQIPNAFTPNSDGHNDTFKIIQNGYVTSIISFRIFTKSGKLIFNDKDGAWDGRFGGVMLDADVYIWIADFINKFNDTEHLSGTVLLLK
jgi:gliding motility-associated-like protein